MKKGICLIILLLMISVLGCEKKQTMSVTGPTGEKASVSFPK